MFENIRAFFDKCEAEFEIIQNGDLDENGFFDASKYQRRIEAESFLDDFVVNFALVIRESVGESERLGKLLQCMGDKK